MISIEPSLTRRVRDYGAAAGYLVVYNLEPKQLIFETGDERPGWPASVSVGDKTVFLVAINTNPETPKASRDGRLDRDFISKETLLAKVKSTKSKARP